MGNEKRSTALKPVVAALLVSLALSGCVSVGNMTAKLLTAKTADLSNASVQVRFIRNLYQTEAQTTEVKHVSAIWQPGANVAVINFLKREGIGMYEIDGTVKLNGELLTHLGSGAYGKVLPADELSAQTFTIDTATGKHFEFTVEPLPEIAIRSINGQSEGATVDLGKSLELELENPSGTENTTIGLKLLANAVGTRAFYEVGIFKSTDKLSMPATVFASSSVPNVKFGFNKGVNYLQVERSTSRLVEMEGVGAAQVISQSWDTAPVQVTGEPNYFTHITAEGEAGAENSPIAYSLRKPNAATGRPFSTAKKFALASLSVRGTLYQQKESTSSTTTGNIKTTTTTTETWQFPPLPTAFWDQLLENINADIQNLMQERYGIQFIPVGQVVASGEYAKLEEIDQESSDVKIKRSYKGTKNLVPTSISGLLGQVSSTFAADRPEARLIRELGVDGLVAITLDLDLPTDTDKVTLRPRMGIRITGPPTSHTAGQAVYLEGGISSDKGVTFNESELENINALNRIVRKEELMAALVQAINELEAQEKELGYDLIWALK